jgi:excisionase family DNA binding protein
VSKKDSSSVSQDSLLNVNQTANLLGLSASAIRAWVLHRKIRFVKLGKAVRFKRSDIDALVASAIVEVQP